MASYEEIYRKKLGRMAPDGGSQPPMAEDRLGGDAKPSYLEGAGGPVVRPSEVTTDPLRSYPGGQAPQPGPLQPRRTEPGGPLASPTIQGPTQDPTQGPAQDPGGYGKAAIGLGDLGALIERRLAQPTAWDSEVVQGIRGNLATEREKSRQEGAARINVDAARRGAFHSTIPTFQTQKLERDLYAQEAMADAQLSQYAADARDRGGAQTVGEAMNFLGQGQNFELQRLLGLGNLGQIALGQGGQGAPDINQALYNLIGMGGGQAQGYDPALLGLVGQLFGAQKSPQQVAAQPTQ